MTGERHGNVIVCTSNARKRQTTCGCGRRAEYECDWPEPQRNSGTCDKPVCDRCKRTIGEKDYCPMHRGDPPAEALTQEELDLRGEEAANEAARILGVKR